jgi:hypothetical protein
MRAWPIARFSAAVATMSFGRGRHGHGRQSLSVDGQRVSEQVVRPRCAGDDLDRQPRHVPGVVVDKRRRHAEIAAIPQT